MAEISIIERDVVVPKVRGRNAAAYGVRTHYAEAGEGEPMILVHGGGPGASGLAGWRLSMPRLAQHHRVLAIDLIGSGMSDKPLIEYDFLTLANHVAGFIDALGLEKVVVSGNSQGAYVAIRYALDNPDRVKAAVLLSSGTIASACGITDSTRPEYPKWDGTREALRAFLQFIINDHSKITDDLLDRRMVSVKEPGHDEAYASLQAWRQLIQKGDGNAVQLYNIGDRLKSLTIPWTMIWAEKDNTASPATIGARFKEMFPQAPFHVVEDAGHQLQTDQPDRFCDIVEAFLGGI